MCNRFFVDFAQSPGSLHRIPPAIQRIDSYVHGRFGRGDPRGFYFLQALDAVLVRSAGPQALSARQYMHSLAPSLAIIQQLPRWNPALQYGGSHVETQQGRSSVEMPSVEIRSTAKKASSSRKRRPLKDRNGPSSA
jgi:hypothetical protein